MPRYRKLYTKTVESLDINDMPDDFTRLFWVLLPLGLCRAGRGIDNTAWVKSKIFPLRLDVTAEMIATSMQWFEDRGMLVRYEAEGRSYFFLPSFPKYQGNTTKEAESNYPGPQEKDAPDSRPTPELVQSKSVTDAIFNTQYSDVDSNADAKRSLSETPTPAAERVQQVQALAGQNFPRLAMSEDLADEIGKLIDARASSLESTARALKWCRQNGIEKGSSIVSACMRFETNKDNGHGSRGPPGGRQPENQAFLDQLLEGTGGEHGDQT